MQGTIELNRYIFDIDRDTSYVYLKPGLDRWIYSPDIKGYEQCKNSEATIAQLGIQITEACNLRCTYCYQFKKRPQTLTFEQGKKFIDIFFGQINDSEKPKFAKFNIQSPFKIHLIGGETMLYPELCYNLIKYFDNKLKELHIDIDWEIWFPTNGTNFDSEYAQKIIDEYKDRLNYQISLDGCEECHNACRVYPNGKGSFDLSNNAFQKLREKDPRFKHNLPTKFTMSPDNIKYYEKSIKDWIDQGIYNIFTNWEGESLYTVEDAKEYYFAVKNVIDYIFEKNLQDTINFIPLTRSDDSYLPQYIDPSVCGAPGHYIELLPNGDIAPCVRLSDSSIDESVKPLLYGNIYDGIGYNEETKYNWEHALSTRSDVSNYKCYNCPASNQCYMCFGLNYNAGGGRRDFRCTNSCLIQMADHLARAYGVNKYYRSKEDINPNMFFKSYHVTVPRDIAEPIIGKEEYDMIKYLAKEW